MHWYNPKTRGIEDVTAPSTDMEALEMLRGDTTIPRTVPTFPDVCRFATGYALDCWFAIRGSEIMP
jgi:hypothetical protein